MGSGPSLGAGKIGLLVIKGRYWVGVHFDDWERFHDNPARVFLKARFALEKAARGADSLTQDEYRELGLDRIPKFDRRQKAIDDDPEIQAMLNRHYRNQHGECECCDAWRTDDEDGQTIARWPCDAAILLRRLGATVREEILKHG